METFFLIISIVWSILVIILFFKLWEMTNDVREIKNSIASNESSIFQSDVMEKFALAFAISLISHEIEKMNPKEYSFEAITSIDICSTGGYCIVSDWYITKDLDIAPNFCTLNAQLVCNDILNYMKPESWKANII